MLEKNNINLSNAMKSFYLDEVIVKKSGIDNLRERKKINIDRLKKGIDDFNKENSTNYKIIEEFEQGSVAMSTLIQSECNDYDIDVAVVFEKEKFNIGCIQAKNIFLKSLNKRTNGFKKEPELKTNCIRVYYEDGYHLDFALFRSDCDGYEHCGSEWRSRNPRDINNWFREQNTIYNNKLRLYTRLLKTFCRSHESWVMPGGLMNTILVSKALSKIATIEDIEKEFITILKTIRDIIKQNKQIINPVDGQSLMLVKDDYVKVENLYNRLEEQLDCYDKLQINNADVVEYIKFWNVFFNNDFWNENKLLNIQTANFEYDEIFIENFYKIFSNVEEVDLYCYKISSKFKTDAQRKLASSYHKKINVKKNEEFVFYLKEEKYITNNYYIIWKVKNNGIEAEKNNCIRGDFYFSNHIENSSIYSEKIHYKERKEKASYAGKHEVYCYIFNRNDILVAKGKYIVEIQ